jgi:hypothetical protein
MKPDPTITINLDEVVPAVVSALMSVVGLFLLLVLQ